MAEEYEKYLNQKFESNNKTTYTITTFLNKGGNGYVYDCVTENGELFVVKILHDFGKNHIKELNFKKEIDLLKSLNSPYIVKCLDSGTLRLKNQQKDRIFYVMKKYDKTLEQMINDNEITPISAYKYSIQLCEALKIMHKRSEPLIHRDLKPENILYDEAHDALLVCDLGLTHINNGNRTINSGFVGNLDYHAPEQKQRGFHEVGTYTDIYSLGLIINVMFTKEIPIGENYKKIWECAPYFHFIDEIINRMVQHDYSKRENDINSVLMELNEHNMEFEVEESFLKIRCSKLGIHPDKVKEVMNLYALSTYFLKNDCNLSVNNNYYCDYHFRCNDKMLNYLLLCILHKKIRNRFETEISEYSQSLCINLNSNEDMLLFESLKNAIDLDTYEKAAYLKANIKKYFQCIYEYHAKEFLDSICKVKNKINYYCLDAPILAITFFVKENAYELENLQSSNFIEIVDYNDSDVIDKNILFFNKDMSLKNFGMKIKSLIKDSSFIIKDNKIKVFFDDFSSEEKFEEILKIAIEHLPTNDVRRYDIIDIIDKAEMELLRKIYVFDEADIQVVQTFLK